MRIYVGHLSPFLTEEELQGAFSALGEVTSTEVVKDRDGVSRRFGYVEMPDTFEAERAIETLDGIDLKGSRLTVNAALFAAEFALPYRGAV